MEYIVYIIPFCLFFYDSYTIFVSLEILGFTFKRGSESTILTSVSNIFKIVLTKDTHTTLSTSSIRTHKRHIFNISKVINAMW